MRCVLYGRALTETTREAYDKNCCLGFPNLVFPLVFLKLLGHKVVMDKNNHLEFMVQKAQEKILGTKFCFSCQKPKPLASGKNIIHGKSRTWRCLECVARKNPSGFGKEKVCLD